MNNSLLFSIIISNYNNGSYVADALNSALNQTYKNTEIIVVDDCSTDNSWNIIRSFETSDARVKGIKNNRNGGVGFSKKKGIKYSSGEILGFLDSDDLLKPNAVEEMVNLHNKYPDYSLIYSNLINCDQDLIPISLRSPNGPIVSGHTYLTQPDTGNHISHFATFKRSFYNLTEGLNAYFKKAIDKDLYYKLEEVGKIMFYDKPLYYYRHHDGSISLFDNVLKARLWEVKAKADAYKRRKYILIKNITKKDIQREYIFIYRLLANENLAEKNYLGFLRQLLKLTICEGSFISGLKYGYYCIIKALNKG
jgi:glycosyltransferase involved in cell wall biosynthesis